MLDIQCPHLFSSILASQDSVQVMSAITTLADFTVTLASEGTYDHEDHDEHEK